MSRITMGMVLFCLAVSSLAQEERQRPDPVTPPQAETRIVRGLAPDPESEEVAEWATFERNGEDRIFKARLAIHPNMAWAYDYTVDEERGTYKLTRTQPDPNIMVGDAYIRVDPKSCDGELAGDPGCGCQALCSGSSVAYMIAKTGTPFAWQLTKTSVSMQWSRKNNQATGKCKWYASGSVYCTASNPDHYGDHWYVNAVNGCVGSGHVTDSPEHIDKTAQGNYYNWDYGNNGVPTYITQQITTEKTVGDPDVHVTISHTDSGEGATLITGALGAATAVDSCD
jgi:hypothetical protein